MLIRRRFASMRWRTRITLWAAATMAGLLVVMFARLADMALAQFAQQTAERPWLPFIYTPLIGMLVVWLTTRFFIGAQGSGIPQVIAATRLVHQGKRRRSGVAADSLRQDRSRHPGIDWRLFGWARRPLRAGRGLDHAFLSSVLAQRADHSR